MWIVKKQQKKTKKKIIIYERLMMNQGNARIRTAVTFERDKNPQTKL
jgi:hypothetical protein